MGEIGSAAAVAISLETERNATMRTSAFRFAAALFAAAAITASAKTTELDWCTVEAPEVWTPGGPFEVTVTLKEGAGIPEGTQANVHMQWFKKDGFGGMVSWHKPLDAVVGKPIVFRHSNKKMKPEMVGVAVRAGLNVFLAPGGDWNKHTHAGYVNIDIGEPAYPFRPKTVTFKKSGLWIDGDAPTVQYPGDVATVKVRYRLDPSDTWGPGKTKISIRPLGPWIDNPDGVINPKRKHVGIPGFGIQTKEVEPGDGEVAFSWTFPGARRTSCFFLLQFIAPDGDAWPWDWRGGSVNFKPYSKFFYVEPDADFGMYGYGETPSFTVHWGNKVKRGTTNAVATVRDVFGEVVAERTFDVAPAARGTSSFDLPGFDRRGTFSVTVKAGDAPEDFCVFATYPKFQRKPGVPTPFGATDIGSAAASRLAADLGFSYVRHFTGWKGLQPLPDVWRLDGLDRTIRANADAGLKPWISLQGAPTWALPEGMHGFGFEPAPLDTNAWAKAVAKLSRRYKGKLWGWEWLNEIVPGGKCEDPVATYLGICKAGTEAARAVDPGLRMQLAGGLWPRNFRTDLLNAGIEKYIDFLPVHYQDFAGVTAAKRDLEVRGIKKVVVADNENASGFSTWNMGAEQMLGGSLSQCLHVLTKWPDELCAGAAFICYFGGGPQVTGNWTYLIDDRTPRPVAVTLAVLQGKLAYARPIGKFFIGSTVVHLFEGEGGRAIAVVRAPGADAETKFGSTGKAIGYRRDPAKKGREVRFPAKGALRVTDFQGGVTAGKGGAFFAGDMPVIVEGADLDALSMHAVLLPGASPVPVETPPCAVTAGGETLPVPLRLFNPYRAKKTFTVSCGALDWASTKPLRVTLAPGERRVEEFALRPTGRLPAAATLSFTVASEGLPSVEQPCRLTIVDPTSIGNLLRNGDMSEGATGRKPPHWNGHGTLEDVPGEPGNRALRLLGDDNGAYRSSGQIVTIPVPGETYLYTAWVWSKGMGAGSNVNEGLEGGGERKWYMPHIFSTPMSGTGYWRFLSKRFETKEDTRSLYIAPVAHGEKGGSVLYDNISLSLCKGGDFACFARREGRPVDCPVPLLCDNQIQSEGGYAWTPQNLAGRASFSWDDEALHFRAEVEDDVLAPRPVASAAGEETLQGDAIALCLFPHCGPDGPEPDQIRWYLSKASPGGGSGTCTVFRPNAFSLGAKSGQLAKDSSVYEISIDREGTKTVYRFRIPWAEIPGFTPAVGATMGCNLLLYDSDGPGAARGRMTWGAGLKADAGDCALITLVD